MSVKGSHVLVSIYVSSGVGGSDKCDHDSGEGQSQFRFAGRSTVSHGGQGISGESVERIARVSLTVSCQL